MLKLLGAKPIPTELHPEAIHLGAEVAAGKVTTRWGTMLVIFMRIVSALWIFQGLLQWKTILAPDGLPLDSMPKPVAVAVAFFAVSDLLAAVGLWLATPWGGVLWLFSACAAIVIALFMPELQIGGRVMLLIDFVLIVA